MWYQAKTVRQLKEISEFKASVPNNTLASV